MFSHWILSVSKSPQLSSTILSILADLNNAVVWIVSSRPLISKSSTPCINPLLTVPSAPITTGITITFMYPSFFQFSCKVEVLIFLFTFFLFYPVAKSTIWQVLFCCCLSLGVVIWPRLGDLFASQNPREVCASHFLGRILGCAYTICSYGQI